ncbi:hypothetical protein STEG23_004923 [Scotinomys teguina]
MTVPFLLNTRDKMRESPCSSYTDEKGKSTQKDYKEPLIQLTQVNMSGQLGEEYAVDSLTQNFLNPLLMVMIVMVVVDDDDRNGVDFDDGGGDGGCVAAAGNNYDDDNVDNDDDDNDDDDDDDRFICGYGTVLKAVEPLGDVAQLAESILSFETNSTVLLLSLQSSDSQSLTTIAAEGLCNFCVLSEKNPSPLQREDIWLGKTTSSIPDSISLQQQPPPPKGKVVSPPTVKMQTALVLPTVENSPEQPITCRPQAQMVATTSPETPCEMITDAVSEIEVSSEEC